jgi:hypothetical protein
VVFRRFGPAPASLFFWMKTCLLDFACVVVPMRTIGLCFLFSTKNSVNVRSSWKECGESIVIQSSFDECKLQASTDENAGETSVDGAGEVPKHYTF